MSDIGPQIQSIPHSFKMKGTNYFSIYGSDLCVGDTVEVRFGQQLVWQGAIVVEGGASKIAVAKVDPTGVDGRQLGDLLNLTVTVSRGEFKSSRGIDAVKDKL